MSDKAKEAVKARNKLKFKLELERTLEENEKLSNYIRNLIGNISVMNDIEVESQLIIAGIHRDILLDIQNMLRIEQLQKVGECDG